MSAARLSSLDGELLLTGDRPDGVCFTCPACPRNAAGSCHSIIVPWNADLRDRLVPRYPLWQASGVESLETLTISPSIDGTKGSCQFHGWIRSGEVSW